MAGIEEKNGPNKTIDFIDMQVSKVESDVLEIILIAEKSIKTNYGSTKAVSLLYLNTESDSLQAGTYPIQEGDTLGTITAGYRIDEKRALGGSILTYALSSYLASGTIAPAHMWRIKSGDMIVDEVGNITLTFKTFGGTTVNATYTAPNVAVDNITAPEQKAQKVIRDGRMIIIKDGQVFDVLGNRL